MYVATAFSELLTPVASVYTALTGALAVRAASMLSAVDAVAGVEAFALVAGVCATLTDAPTTRVTRDAATM